MCLKRNTGTISKENEEERDTELGRNICGANILKRKRKTFKGKYITKCG